VTAQSEKQAYIDDMVRQRGYVLDYHRVLTQHDFDFMKKSNELIESAYLKKRRLDRASKELIFVTTLTVMRADKHQIRSHIRVALKEGLTPEEILEALEIVLPEAGVVAFQHGFDAWTDVVGAEGIEPSPGLVED
jgi:4-carboxymuconolactone decarboxylase